MTLPKQATCAKEVVWKITRCFCSETVTHDESNHISHMEETCYE